MAACRHQCGTSWHTVLSMYENHSMVSSPIVSCSIYAVWFHVFQNEPQTYKTNPVNGYQTNVVEYYNYIQPIKVSSNDVAKIDELTKSYEVLLEQGLNISSEEQPQYHYSKLADLKVTLLEKATKDARNRAKSMLKSNHNRLGKIRSARMGVFQITPVDSNDVSDSGYNDLSSIEKKVTAVANVTFAIK